MRTLTLITILTVSLACATNEEEAATTTETGAAEETPTTEPTAEVLPSWDATLSADAGSAITGEAVARATAEGGTFASAAIDGAEPNAVHPWHVHEGTCGSNGPIVGDPAAYPPLTVNADGAATADATLSLALDEAGDYYVNIHQSPENLGTIVACGELQTG